MSERDALCAVANEARLISQWADAPWEEAVLRAELAELGRAARAALALASGWYAEGVRISNEADLVKDNQLQEPLSQTTQGLAAILTEWATRFLGGLSFNEPALQRKDWAAHRAPVIASSIMAALRDAASPPHCNYDCDRCRAAAKRGDCYDCALNPGACDTHDAYVPEGESGCLLVTPAFCGYPLQDGRYCTGLTGHDGAHL